MFQLILDCFNILESFKYLKTKSINGYFSDFLIDFITNFCENSKLDFKKT
jgi:hypothetical protein